MKRLRNTARRKSFFYIAQQIKKDEAQIKTYVMCLNLKLD